jgi:hypothetical protein
MQTTGSPGPKIASLVMLAHVCACTHVTSQVHTPLGPLPLLFPSVRLLLPSSRACLPAFSSPHRLPGGLFSPASNLRRPGLDPPRRTPTHFRPPAHTVQGPPPPFHPVPSQPLHPLCPPPPSLEIFSNILQTDPTLPAGARHPSLRERRHPFLIHHDLSGTRCPSQSTTNSHPQTASHRPRIESKHQTDHKQPTRIATPPPKVLPSSNRRASLGRGRKQPDMLKLATAWI